MRRRPNAQLFCSKPGRSRLARWRSCRPQRMLACSIQRLSCSRAFSGMPKRRRRAGTSSRSRMSAAVKRHCGRCSSASTALGQRRGGAGAAVAEGVGQMARVIPFQAAEHGVDVGRVGFNVRHHHDHVPGAQVRVGGEARQQGVLQDFHFPLRAVGDAEPQRAVGLRRRALRRRRVGGQFQHILLELLQQGSGPLLALRQKVDPGPGTGRSGSGTRPGNGPGHRGRTADR